MDGNSRLKHLPWLVLVVLILAFVDAPMWHGGLFRGDDTEIHLYRLVDLDHLIRHGVLYSRWQPDLVYGYGSPLFSFYAPLSAYLAEAGHLAGLSLRSGLKLEFAFLPLVAASATYLFLRRRLALGPALLGALVYPTSWYFLYNVYVRGSISDALAMALFPVALLALDRLLDRPGPGRLAGFALSYAAILLGHDISGPMILPLLVFTAIWWSAGERRRLIWASLGLGLGIGMALFFLGPAALDASQTRVPEFLAAPGMRFDQHFIGLGDVFATSAVAYPGAMLASLPLGLGLIPSILGALAVVVVPRLKRTLRGEVAIFAFLLAACVFLTLPASGVFWGHLPVLPLVHYPWRFLALATFANALLVGYAAQGVFAGRGRRFEAGVLAAVALVLLLLAVPFLYPAADDTLPANPSFAQLTAFQQRSGALGSTSNSEFLPHGLARFPKGPPFVGADAGASLSRKMDPFSLPAGARVQVRADGQLSTQLRLTSPTDFVARFDVFRFPGWSATLDGRPVPLAAPGLYQTVTVAIPAGRHVLGLGFGETRTRLLFDLVSILCTVVVVGLGLRGTLGCRVSWLRARPICFTPPFLGPSLVLGSSVPAVLGAVLLAAVLKPTVFDRGLTPLVRPFDGQHPPGMVVSDRHRFDPSFELLGYTWDQGTGQPGQTLHLTLYWRTSARQSINYSSFVHLLDASGQRVVGADNLHVADYPTSWWRVGAYARDVHQVVLPASLPPGTYRVEVGLYDPIRGRQLKIDGTQTDSLALPSLWVQGAP